MSSILISGDTSGAITLAAPAVAGTTTLTLPASTGTLVTTASPASGNVIQVVNSNYSTFFSTSSGSLVSTGLAATITPKFSTSKILILIQVECYNDTANRGGDLTIYRNSTNLGSTILARMFPVSGQVAINIPINYYDSPSTTSATTYTLYAKTANPGSAFNVFQDGFQGTMTLLEIAA